MRSIPITGAFGRTRSATQGHKFSELNFLRKFRGAAAAPRKLFTNINSSDCKKYAQRYTFRYSETSVALPTEVPSRCGSAPLVPLVPPASTASACDRDEWGTRLHALAVVLSLGASTASATNL